MKTIEEFSEKKKVRRVGQQTRKKGEEKTKRAMGVGSRARELVKWNQMTALRFQTGVGDIRHPRLSLGG